MAKATPVAVSDSGSPAPATEILATPASAKPAKADKAELDAMVAEAEAAKKTALVIGNAVRVDN